MILEFQDSFKEENRFFINKDYQKYTNFEFILFYFTNFNFYFKKYSPLNLYF
jgi:hypothetical protein